MSLSVIVTILNMLITGVIFDNYKQAAEKNIISVLGKGELSEFSKESGHEYYLFRPENSGDSAYVVFSSVKGRYENFEYMVIINKSISVVDIKILKYRSEYGYEVSNKGWLKQFYLKPDISFEYRKNIDTLSGATFSAQSLVNDINYIIDYLRLVRKNPQSLN